MATVVPIRAPRGKLLTLSEVCEELQIALSTFYDWKGKGAAPRCIKLPNGKLRIRRTDLDAWINAREVAA
jgi:predicted DNA-binding transcriptional regulator AlpA